MNPDDQALFDGILAKLARKEPITEIEADILRARRSYLSPRQRFQYLDILYLRRQFLIQKVKDILLSKFTKDIVVGLIITLIIYWLTKLVALK